MALHGAFEVAYTNSTLSSSYSKCKQLLTNTLGEKSNLCIP